MTCRVVPLMPPEFGRPLRPDFITSECLLRVARHPNQPAWLPEWALPISFLTIAAMDTCDAASVRAYRWSGGDPNKTCSTAELCNGSAKRRGSASCISTALTVSTT